ncbi:hypothetical protein KI387_041215, partial [Taxus chinensis]
MEDIFLARWEAKKKHNFVKEEEEDDDDEFATHDSESPRKEASIFQFEGCIQRKK